MATYEDHITAIENSDLPEETMEAACQAVSFAAYFRNFYVVTGVLNEEDPIDCQVLEPMVESFHGELAAAAILLSEDSFNGVTKMLNAMGKVLEKEEVVPVYVREGFGRLATRIEEAKKERVAAAAALEMSEVVEGGSKG